MKYVELTRRERELVDLILEKNPSNAEIAQEMDISTATVNMFLNRVYRESDLNVKKNRRRAELINQAEAGEIIFIDKPSS